MFGRTVRFLTPAAMVALIAAALFAGSARAADISMIAPNIPPHFEADGKGRIGEVISETLKSCGHTVHFTLVPFGRHWKDYQDDPSLMALATAEADQSFPGFSTKPFMHLQDGATVVAGRGLDAITKVEALKGKRVVAFPNAPAILGITDLVPSFGDFRERADRFDQVRPLLSGRADAVLADGLITAHFIGLVRDGAMKGAEPGIDPAIKVKFRRIFPPGPQRLYFRDQALAKDFDRCFEALRASGAVERIAAKYVDRYRAIMGDQYPRY